MKQIFELATKLKILVEESITVTENLKKMDHYFDSEKSHENIKKSDLDNVINNLQQLSNGIKDKDFVSKEDIEIIIRSYNEIIINIKEWKKIRRSVKTMTKEQMKDLEINEEILLKVITMLRKKIEVMETKTENMKLKLAIKRLVNYIDDECRTLKI